MSQRIPIEFPAVELWLKVLGMLEQNWAYVDDGPPGCRIVFVDDAGHVFDALECADRAAAEAALRRNGFERFVEDETTHGVIAPPALPFIEGETFARPVYSSGRFWR